MSGAHLDALWTEEEDSGTDPAPTPYSPFSLSPSPDGSSRFLTRHTPAGNSAKSSAVSARLCFEIIFETRKDVLLTPQQPPELEITLRRLIRDDETGGFTHRAGRVIRKRRSYTACRSGKFVRLDLAGKSGLLDAWLMGDIPWEAPRDDDVWDAAAQLCNDAQPPPSGFELIEMSALLNRILGARAGVELSVFDVDD